MPLPQFFLFLERKMNVRFCWTPVLILIAVSATAQEQQPSPKKVNQMKPVFAEVRLTDGSLVRMSLLQNSLEVQTKFGKLNIPFCEIRRIEFGIHFPIGLQDQIDKAVSHLGSDIYKEREGAAKFLVQTGYLACPALRKATKSEDMEVAQRAETVLKKVTDRATPEQLRKQVDDIIHTTDFPVRGRIVSPNIKMHSMHFGEQSLLPSQLVNMHVRTGNEEHELLVDAMRWGSAPDQWMDSGIFVDTGQRIIVDVKGIVDLWPQGPGQYMATPKGYTVVGRGGQFQAGALIGKVGQKGTPFLIGEQYDSAPNAEGNLHFHIVPSPWNNASSGSYSVRVHIHHVLTQK